MIKELINEYNKPDNTLKIYDSCTLCPRRCRTGRSFGNTGFCGLNDKIKIARAALHFWEEPCISGKRGSGAVFFSGCTLKCVYCQNLEISRGLKGREITANELCDTFLQLENKGAENINLVTPDHFIPGIQIAMEQARAKGLKIPFVVNCSGYETNEMLKILEGLSNIYLTDFKYWDRTKAGKYSMAEDYPDRAIESLREMVRQRPELVFDDRGMLQSGVIVRHLLLPGMVRDAKNIVRYVHSEYGNKVRISLLNQYTPPTNLSFFRPNIDNININNTNTDNANTDNTNADNANTSIYNINYTEYPELLRKVRRKEYEKLLNYAIELGVEDAYIQEEGSTGERYIPEWDEV